MPPPDGPVRILLSDSALPVSMGTAYGPAANLPPEEPDDARSLAEVVDGVFADVDVDSVEAVREVRRDE